MNMTFAETLAEVARMADGVSCHLQIEAWGNSGPAGVKWIAYRAIPWDGERSHIEAASPEMLLERIRDAIHTLVETPTMPVGAVVVS